jgi:hypothetical protein
VSEEPVSELASEPISTDRSTVPRMGEAVSELPSEPISTDCSTIPRMGER